jgi:hypothetical protein
LRIHSNPGKGDVVARLRSGGIFRAECKKGSPVEKSKLSGIPAFEESSRPTSHSRGNWRTGCSRRCGTAWREIRRASRAMAPSSTCATISAFRFSRSPWMGVSVGLSCLHNNRLEKDLRPDRFARWSRPLSLKR